MLIEAVVADRRYTGVAEVSFPSNTKLVAFEFRGFSLKTRQDRMTYRYRLEGYDADWQTTRENRVEYEDLPRGDYRFEVVAIDRDMAYSETPATVALSVHLPYERIGWSSVLGIAVVLILWQGVQIVRRNRALKGANQALSGANRDLFGVNRALRRGLWIM